ncbi:glutamine-hydrolyzing GMP synthase [Candidatus Epulonipiscioides saccharophilum]|nr:glutamine-hydrolyzing GMP synthase [Epulopiscium sp. SCG-B10WGA-EpuloB]
MDNQLIVVLDFGGQYNQLIARRIRERGVYCEVHPYNISIEKLRSLNPKGIIFTGGPNSIYESGSISCDKDIFQMGIPILGICYGAQLIAYTFGGEVKSAEVSEYGKTELCVNNKSLLFDNIPQKTICWMSHTDFVNALPDNFEINARTKDCPIAGFEDSEKKIYALQFHPEVMHTECGEQMLDNFAKKVCNCVGDWKMADFANNQIESLRKYIGPDKKALLALSGGVDSSVCAAILSKAIGKGLTCVFVDHGLLRKDEAKEVIELFSNNSKMELNFICVDARERFFAKLEGVIDPEKKRKIIGEEFIKVFEEEAKRIGAVDFLVQGTIYPDVIESGLGKSAVIKSHHNVGGLPDYVDFKEIIEPLRLLFKDEVRKVGLELGLSKNIVNRQPFPGPGLGIRIIGEVTREKVKIVQEADYIYREVLAEEGVAERQKLDQYFVALTNMRSVGVMGDSRTYDYAVVLRAVETSDFMTANSVHIPWDILEKITSRIINEVKGVNRVLYDLTGKPPATIELE